MKYFRNNLCRLTVLLGALLFGLGTLLHPLFHDCHDDGGAPARQEHPCMYCAGVVPAAEAPVSVDIPHCFEVVRSESDPVTALSVSLPASIRQRAPPVSL